MLEQFRFADLNSALYLFIIPLIILILFYARQRRKKLLNKFTDQSQLNKLTGDFNPKRRKLKQILLLLSFLFLILALMRPQGDPVKKKVEKKGRDLIFVIDVSRSMLAEDLKPNRLERAKFLVSEVIDQLDGDRVALLTFAGGTAVKSPLTHDFYFFKAVLEGISPLDVNRGGTNIGDAIRAVTDKLFYDQDNKFRDVILITDGEDHDSFPLDAAREAAKKGIKIHTIGLGDPFGANIPIKEKNNKNYKLLKHDDETIKTKLDEKTLKEIASITKGVFIPVRTKQVDIARIYHKYIAIKEKHQMEVKETKIWRELYQFFLAIGILFLMIETLIGERRRRTLNEAE